MKCSFDKRYRTDCDLSLVVVFDCVLQLWQTKLGIITLGRVFDFLV